MHSGFPNIPINIEVEPIAMSTVYMYVAYGANTVPNMTSCGKPGKNWKFVRPACTYTSKSQIEAQQHSKETE